MTKRIVYKKSFFYNKILGGISESEVKSIIDMGVKTCYMPISIPKKDGTVRQINAIDSHSSLYVIQKRIKENLLDYILLPNCIKGFVSDKSYKDYLVEHVGKSYFLHVDIKDFFPSITRVQLIESLYDIIVIPNKKENYEVVNSIIKLCTIDDILPQGAITSPSLSNLVFRNVDRRIEKYCEYLDVHYTRYADDLLFSSDTYDFSERFDVYKKIVYILKDNYFRLNYKKTRIHIGKHIVNGIIIDDVLSISRRKNKKVSFIYFCFQRYKKYIKEDNYKLFLQFLDYEQSSINLSNKCHYDLSAFETSKNNQGDWAAKYPNINSMLDYFGGYRSYLIDWLSSDEILINCEGIKKQIKKIEEMMLWLNQIEVEKSI